MAEIIILEKCYLRTHLRFNLTKFEFNKFSKGKLSILDQMLTSMFEYKYFLNSNIAKAHCKGNFQYKNKNTWNFHVFKTVLLWWLQTCGRGSCLTTPPPSTKNEEHLHVFVILLKVSLSHNISNTTVKRWKENIGECFILKL